MSMVSNTRRNVLRRVLFIVEQEWPKIQQFNNFLCTKMKPDNFPTLVNYQKTMIFSYHSDLSQ